MLNIVSTVSDSNSDEIINLEQSVVNKVIRDALQTIKNGLPKEVQTVETMEYVISEMQKKVKVKRINL